MDGQPSASSRLEPHSPHVESRPHRDGRILVGATVAALVFAMCTAVAISPEPPAWELDLFQAINGLPDWLFVLIWPFMQYGVFVTIPIATAVAVVRRRPRLGAMLGVSGLGIYFAAKAVKRIAERGRPDAFLALVEERERFGASLGYPSGHAAVAGTIATLTFFHLPKPLRRLTVALIAIVWFGRVYVGAHLPLDLVGGTAMGVTTGCVVTYLFGARKPQESGDLSTEIVDTTSRHPGDIARIVVGITVLLIAVLAVQRSRLTLFEEDLFRLVNDLPGVISPLVMVVMQGGNVFASLAVAGAALAARARRLAVDVALAGPLAWIAAKGVKALIERPRPVGFLEDLHRVGPSGLGFVSGHTAVAAAIATAAAPYLPRRARRLLWVLVWVVGLSRIYVGAHLPLDIVGGAALGWMIGAGLHLLLGAPHGAPGLREAEQVLERSGWLVSSVRRVGNEPSGSFPFIAEGPDGRRFVKLLDPEARDRDWIFRIARLLAFRDVRDEARMADPRFQGEHEAAMTMLARAAGCRAPAVQGIHHVHGRTWVVEEVAGDTPLDRHPDVSPEVLAAVWLEVRTLHAAGMAHRDLVASNVVIDGLGRPWLVDFAHALAPASPLDQDNDIAELLVSTAVLVGAALAVDSAIDALGATSVRRATGELQPLALSAATRRTARLVPDLLPELRRLTEGDVPDDPTTDSLPARRRRHLAGGLLGVGGLLALASPLAVLDRLSAGPWRWYGVVAIVALVLWFQGGALVIAAARRRLGLGRASTATAEAAAAGLITGVSPQALLADRLHRIGLIRSEAAAAARTVSVVRLAVAAASVPVALLWVLTISVSWSLPGRWWTLVLLAIGCGAIIGAGWRTGSKSVRSGSRDRSPTPLRWAGLVGMAIAEFTLWALLVVAVEKACGGDAAIAILVLGAAVAGLLASAGNGAPGLAEVTVSVVLVTLGVGLPTAVATVLVARGIVFWIPAAAAPLVLAPLRKIWAL